MKAGIRKRSERLNQNELRSEFVPLFTHAKETMLFTLAESGIYVNKEEAVGTLRLGTSKQMSSCALN